MTLTIEAIYTLHLLNEFSDDLAFLPLPIEEGETRKEALKRALLKGMDDLHRVGLLEENVPTDECVELGCFLKQYHEARYHCRIDSSHCLAPQVDAYKNMSVLILEVEDGLYEIHREMTLFILGGIISSHKLLQKMEEHMKDYLHSSWEPESFLRIKILEADSPALRIESLLLDSYVQDFVFYERDNHHYQFDMEREQERSIDFEELQSLLLEMMKVRV